MPIGRRLAVLLCALFAALAIAAGPVAAASDLAGHWKGSIDIPGMKLEIDVDFAGAQGAWTGDITIPAQGAKDLPLADIELDGDAVTFKLPSVPGGAAFSGTLMAGGAAISGNFTQGGQTFPFTLASGSSPAAAARAALDGFDAVVEKALADFKVPGLAMAVIAGGEPVLMKGYGVRDMERGLPVTEQTLFAIGSSTKAFTAFVLGSLAGEGAMDWDRPLTDYIPGFRLEDESIQLAITPRDLVTHRCGLPRHDLVWYNNTELTRREIVARMAYLEPNKDLREAFQYNNLAFLTAGHLAEILTGKTWEECVRERIFTPLEMTQSNFSVDESQRAVDFALGYREDEGVLLRMPFRSITNMGPAGSINSSVAEMSRWVALQLGRGAYQGKSLIPQSVAAELHTPQMVIASPPDPSFPEMPQTSYAMGWFVQPYRGHYRLQHGGNIDGFSALVSFLPQDDVGLVILVNKNETSVPGLLERTALDRILDLPGRDWLGEALEKKAKGEAAGEEAEKKAELLRVRGTKPSHALADYAGSYAHPGYGDIKVAMQGKSLSITINHIENPLEHWHYDVFSCAKGAPDPVLEDTKVQFTTDMSGNVDGLRMSLEPMVDDIVFARRPDERLSNPGFLARLAGSYSLVDETVRFEVKGSGLVLVVPGQPAYDLTPDRGTGFKIKGINGYSVVFVLGPDERVQEVRFNQPNGVFTGKPTGR